MNKEIKLYGEIGHSIKAADLARTFADLERQGCKSLTIRLHSQGGEVIEGNAIYNIIQQSPIHTTIVIDGIAASMASIVILAADEVEICDNAFIMIHRPNGGGGGNADDIRATAKVLQDIENTFIRAYSSKTGLKADDIKTKWLNGSDNWLNADEAVEYGFATRKVAAVAKSIKAVQIGTQTDVKNIYRQFAASLNNDNNFNMKKELIETFNLQGITLDSTDEEILQALVDKFDALEKQVNESTEASINGLLSSAYTDGKISPTQADIYKQIGRTSGIAALTAVLNDLKPYVPITSQIRDYKPNENKLTAKSTWTLDDYRRYAPNELRDNPNLYADLIKKEYGSQQ